MIKNVNTIEEYKNSDKASILQQAAKTVSRPLLFDGKELTFSRSGTQSTTAPFIHVLLCYPRLWSYHLRISKNTSSITGSHFPQYIPPLLGCL